MTKLTNRLDEAIRYHEAMPVRIRQYLNGRGIPDETINSYLLGWNGWRITIPIYNREGAIVFFKLAKDPQDRHPSPEIINSPSTTVELYGWDRVIERPSRIVVCEGEFDRLVLEARGFAAVNSTGGAAVFRPEWAKQLNAIEEVYVCFDRNQAGRNGTMLVGAMVPKARRVQLPDEVGEGGNVTEFFVRLRRTKEEFLSLLETATPIPASALPQERDSLPDGPQPLSSLLDSRIERIKRALPIEEFIGKYVQLKPTALGAALIGRCPFHDDRTLSLAVFPERGTYHCFSCRAHGDVISFARSMHEFGFAEALERIEQMIDQNGKDPQHNDQQDEAA
jgi:DNA primase